MDLLYKRVAFHSEIRGNEIYFKYIKEDSVRFALGVQRLGVNSNARKGKDLDQFSLPIKLLCGGFYSAALSTTLLASV